MRDCDLGLHRETRRHWPFLRDRRIDAYGGLLQRSSTATGDRAGHTAATRPDETAQNAGGARLPHAGGVGAACGHLAGWPHNEATWPGKFEPIPGVCAEMVRALAPGERGQHPRR